MKAKALLSAFSVKALEVGEGGIADVRFHRLTDVEARAYLGRETRSYVGHEGSAAVFARLLQASVPTHRGEAKLAAGDRALLGQYAGPRLPEGRVLTEEEFARAGVHWYLVEVR